MRLLKLVSILLVSSCAASKEKEHAAANGWGFIDTKSGASAALLIDPPRLILAEDGTTATFCENDSKFYCFSSEIFDFAVPRSLAKQKSWQVNGRVYCVVRKYPSVTGNEDLQDTYLIFSTLGATCENQPGFDTSAVYSVTHGLRMMNRQRADGGFHELFSIDLYGFGASGTK